ncbi:Coproporphyrinogen III oxidase [Cladochytrium replicatum]|nr:Coproporphyrinogen III oxidase [Cladochytrium replicatum]
MEAHVRKTQNDIVHAIEELEGPSGGRFKRDSWIRKEGGEGLTCVLQDGKVFQKAGVAVSVIHSIAPDGMLTQMRAKKNPNLGKGPFKMFVGGISLVMHPHNPNAPTVHMNYRYFELYPVDGSSKKPVLWWFGGGSDLTPSYLFEEDAEHFHKTIKDVCDKHDPEYYPKFKKWCDGYFNNTHRGDERRGIGGIFFDDLDDREPEKLFEFVKDASQAFLKQYIPIMEKRKDMPFTEEMTRWQQIRRGRYVEFNLVHDRGTKFGLATPSARIESIFLSLPLTARWEYMHAPLPGSEEFKLLEVLRKPRDWA